MSASEPANAAPPPDNELIIGLVGALGIDLEQICKSIEVVLSEFGYTAHAIRLSRTLASLDWDQDLTSEPFDVYVASHMTAGDRLCSPDCWDRTDAFGLLAVNQIAIKRRAESGTDSPADRQAYVVRSFKRPEEVERLRSVYGSRFILIAAYAPSNRRGEHLEEQIRESRTKPHSPTPQHTAEDLMRRDENEGIAWGQNVLGTFHLADFFIDATDLAAQVAIASAGGRTRQDLRHRVDLRRAFEILFGHPNRTPTREEFGMFQAAAAMRRSAELRRQVGSAITTADGDVVAVGVNEVPKPGGGLYWEDDPGDKREFQLGFDTSDEQKRKIAEQIVDGLASAEMLIEGVDRDAVLAEIGRTDVDSLIEYIRAVHAEMAAIADAARRGIPVQGCTLFVTTFPCHHCARHIVAAGINRVVYVSPYSKSMAEELHNDAIVVACEHNDDDPRVRFDPFVGVGPRRYLELFEAPERKDKLGRTREFTPTSAQPRLSDLDPWDLRQDELPYLRREQLAQELLQEVMDRHEPKPVVAEEALRN